MYPSVHKESVNICSVFGGAFEKGFMKTILALFGGVEDVSRKFFHL